jgi:hypothetical protein
MASMALLALNFQLQIFTSSFQSHYSSDRTEQNMYVLKKFSQIGIFPISSSFYELANLPIVEKYVSVTPLEAKIRLE